MPTIILISPCKSDYVFDVKQSQETKSSLSLLIGSLPYHTLP